MNSLFILYPIYFVYTVFRNIDKLDQTHIPLCNKREENGYNFYDNDVKIYSILSLGVFTMDI